MRKGCLIILLMLTSFTLGAAKPVKDVGIALRLNDFTHLFVRNNIIALNANIWLKWQSGQISAQDRYFYDDQVTKKLNKMWWPRYQIIFSRGKIAVDEQSMVIKKDGEVLYEAKLSFNVEIAMDLKRFPFDYQTLDLLFRPVEPSPYQVQYHIMRTQVEGLQVPPLIEWKQLSLKQNILGKNQQAYQLKIEYQRKSNYYIFRIFLPMLMIMMISYLLFWIPGQQPITRISVIVTSLLTLVAFEWTFNDTIPRVSYITFIQAMIVFAFFLVSSMALLVVIAESVSEHRKKQIFRYAKIIYPLLLIIGMVLVPLSWL